jgi:flagellar biosynthesis protein FliP
VRAGRAALAGVLVALGCLLGVAGPASAAVAPIARVSGVLAAPTAPTAPEQPVAPTDPAAPDNPTLEVNVAGGADGEPSTAIVVLLAITVLSVAPPLLLLTTSFTKFVVVLSITRNALGLAQTPPNQVIAGIALFLTLFVMGPVISQVNDQGVQPYLRGEISQSQAFERGVAPLEEFMLDHTRAEDLALVTRAADRPNPTDRSDVPLTTLIPAFVLSELRAAFIIGFVIFVPFLVIDIVVSAALMSMGMMMLPPVTISLPFKLLLFVLVDGWGLVVRALVGSYG